MCDKDINDLPEAVRENRISIEEAVNLIWEDAYVHPYKYGIVYLNEDQKSDFLLEIRPKLKKLLSGYKGGDYNFTQFLFVKISNYKWGFLREQLDDEHKRKSIDLIMKAKTEEDCQRYSDFVDACLDDCEKEETENEKLKRLSDIIGQGSEDGLDRQKKIAELTTLVLMLKACKDVDDATVCAVSDFTDVGRDALYEEILNMKKSMVRRDDNSLKIINRRNNAFYYHRKYLQEMLSPVSTERKKRLLRDKYEAKTKKWYEINDELDERNKTPSNKEVARAIGIKPRMVSFYIKMASKKKGMTRIQKRLQEKNLLNETENDTEKKKI